MLKSIINKLSRESFVKIIENYENNHKVIFYYKDNIELGVNVDKFKLCDYDKRIILYNENCEVNIDIYDYEYIFKFSEEESIMMIYLFDNLKLAIYDVEYKDFITFYNDIESIQVKSNVDPQYKNICFVTALDCYTGYRWLHKKNRERDIIEISSSFMLEFLDYYLKKNVFEIKNNYYSIRLTKLNWQGEQYTYKRIYGNGDNILRINNFENSYVEIIGYYYNDVDEIEIEEKVEDEIEDEILDITDDLENVKTGLITLKINNEIFIHLEHTDIKRYKSIKDYNDHKLEERNEANKIEREFWSNLDEYEYESYINMYEK